MVSSTSSIFVVLDASTCLFILAVCCLQHFFATSLPHALLTLVLFMQETGLWRWQHFIVHMFLL